MASVPLDRIILFGDSLTELSWDERGLAASLAAQYTRKLEVQNMGLSGYNTRWALPCLKQWLPKKDAAGPKTQIMTIWLGANDSALPGEPQHVPVDEYASSLHSIISLLRSPSSPYHSPSTSLILLTPPPFYPPDWIQTRIGRGLPPVTDRQQENTRKYVEAVKRVGQEEGVPVVDVYGPIWEAAGGKEEGLKPFFTDGLHLNENSYKFVVDGVNAVIAKHYPEKMPDNLPLLFPYWRALGLEFASAEIAVEQLAKDGVEPF